MRKLWHSVLLSILATAWFSALAQEKSPVVRFDPALDDIVPPGAKVEKVAGNFGFTEGPVWVRQGGYLLFSDIPANVINKWNPADGKVSVFLDKSGFTGADPAGVGGEQINERGTFYLIGSEGAMTSPRFSATSGISGAANTSTADLAVTGVGSIS